MLPVGFLATVPACSGRHLCTFVSCHAPASRTLFSEGRTALHWAVACEQDECVAALLEGHKVSCTATTNQGLSPMHLAARAGNARVRPGLFTSFWDVAAFSVVFIRIVGALAHSSAFVVAPCNCRLSVLWLQRPRFRRPLRPKRWHGQRACKGT